MCLQRREGGRDGRVEGGVGGGEGEKALNCIVSLCNLEHMSRP